VAMEPQDPYARWVARRGQYLASDEDRERVVEVLKAAFVQGRLKHNELAWRAGRALESRTYTELIGLTADIPPARPVATQPPTRPAPPPRSVNWKVVAWVVGLAIVLPGLGVAFMDTYYGSFFILLSIGFAAASAIGSPSEHRRHRAF
jgi:hypothetical protein